LIRPLDCAQIFRGVSVGCIPWSSMESLVHADDVRSGRTTDATKVPAEKVHNFVLTVGSRPNCYRSFSGFVSLE
jgi:hypothetical protein